MQTATATAASTALETEWKFWTALLAALASLMVALITHVSNRSNQRAIEELRHRHTEDQAERDARRDYQYEARKRLYQACGPIVFQLAELADGAYYRIMNLGQSASQGSLTPGPRSFLRQDYYRISTIYRLLAPAAAFKLMQRRLTLVDLSLDYGIHRRYILMKQAFLAFGDEFSFARLGPHPLDYRPFDEEARTRARTEPATYWRQGLPLGIIEGVIESLLATDEGDQQRIMTYAECEAEYNKADSRLRAAFDSIGFLIKDFTPATRPVFWRMLVTQACIYRALSDLQDVDRPDWGAKDLALPQADTIKFDWRQPHEPLDEGITREPMAVAAAYLDERLTPRFARVSPTASQMASRRT